jgi:tetratricopeptide (TPR) repeat protein
LGIDIGLFRRYLPLAAGVVLITLSGLTIMRNADWKDDIALFSRVAEEYPDNAYGHAGLGEAYLLKESRSDIDLTRAEREFEKALALNPLVPGARTKMGYIRLSRGDSEGAVQDYTFALGAYPLDKEALLNRGIALENIGKQKEALDDFRRFLSIPGHEFSDARPYAEGRVRELSAQVRM